MVEWHKVADGLPRKPGEYLVVKTFFGRRKIDVTRFALDLNKVDRFDFPDEKRPGWYEYDSESGYYETDRVTHWAMLPAMPKE